MTVRRAIATDAAAIVALGDVVVPATYGPIDQGFAAHQLEQWWSVKAVGDGLERLPHWVVEEDGAVTGVANLGEHEGLPVMWKLYVHPERQGAGIGSSLLTEVEAAAGPVLTLEYVGGNDRAAEFYDRRGYVETGRTRFESWPHLDWVWMRKDLA
ncbi:GNAT family N-acetyltransferase [Nocardioides aestuarii]|uniref:GNAT family N-acetyltransferase n=1 Tax=Nocardioides aestuarii TaxID=252231 RepID=A0ABW4TMP7_9ACTN